jgi:hypothetical protein
MFLLRLHPPKMRIFLIVLRSCSIIERDRAERAQIIDATDDFRLMSVGKPRRVLAMLPRRP